MASSSRKLPLLFILLAVVVAAVHAAAAAAPVPVPAPAQAQKYCGDTLAGLKACGSFVFGGGAAKPSPACCAAYAAVYASGESLCLCYLDDGTFWSAVGAGDANATAAAAAKSFLIPDKCGQVGRPPIQFRCEDSGPDEIPPYGPQGTPPAQPPAISAGAGGAPTAQAPSESGPEKIPPPHGPQGTPAAQPPPAISAGAGDAPKAPPPSAHSVDIGSRSIAKARRDSSPELLMLLVVVAALCSIIV
ncbi:unnamed protein product [Urochloa decumbens]|uniref:Bifunctional inhibitor/plant lipid transfer protein/seed storage helical domain-containing protein n=1 Tax=Urochloa decumbens TaxID=240449 RepID=A0ABC9AQ51_9POAL